MKRATTEDREAPMPPDIKTAIYIRKNGEILDAKGSLMDSTTKAIAFLRSLTLDGLLSSEEVWSLGQFFNDNPECATSWPGDILVPMLQSAFDDGRLSEEEITLLAETISSIEAEWEAKHPRTEDEIDEERTISVGPAVIPVIDARVEINSPRDEQSFVVALRDHSCTCPDWQRRKALPPRHPGKCCKHVAHAFARTGKVLEPWFQALLDDCFACARGTDPRTDWRLLKVAESKPVLLGFGPGAWCRVFAPGDDGYGPFAFNPKKSRWSYGECPRHGRLIARAIHENVLLSTAVPA